MKLFRTLLAAVASIGIIGAAFAQTNNIFFTSKGDLTFPFGNPKANGDAGTIDNMTIGASKARAGTFTTLTADTIAGGGAASIICGTYAPNITPAATDKVFFIATRSMIVASISQVHTIAAGGVSTLQVTKDTGTDVPGAGTDLLATPFNLNATANTTQAGALAASAATLTLAAGNRLAVDYANTIQSTAGVVVTACMTPL